MIIKRNIDGKEIEIELTKQELFEAYEAQQAEWDLDYCHNYLLAYKGDDGYDSLSKEKLEEFEAEMAYEYRQNIDKYQMYEEYAASAAFHSAADRCGISL